MIGNPRSLFMVCCSDLLKRSYESRPKQKLTIRVSWVAMQLRSHVIVRLKITCHTMPEGQCPTIALNDAPLPLASRSTNKKRRETRVAPEGTHLVSQQLSLAPGPNQVGEQRLNLNRSWYKDHSHAYNTPFYFKSYTKDLFLPIFTSAFGHDKPTTFTRS